MSIAMVIKQADFSVNKLATVQLIDDIPCTGITINKTSTEISTAETLIASVTPVNTTDTVTWASSDTTVATVNNGVVSAVSSGYATITATCGNYSATCAVTVAIPIAVSKAQMLQVGVANNNTLLDYAKVTSSSMQRYITLGATGGGYPAYGFSADESLLALHPMPIPFGATHINVGIGADYGTLIVYYDKNEKAVDSDTFIRDCAKVVDGETANSGTPWSISAWTYGDRVYTIPSTQGINSFTIGVYCKTDAAYSAFDETNPNVTITYDNN